MHQGVAESDSVLFVVTHTFTLKMSFRSTTGGGILPTWIKIDIAIGRLFSLGNMFDMDPGVNLVLRLKRWSTDSAISIRTKVSTSLCGVRHRLCSDCD